MFFSHGEFPEKSLSPTNQISTNLKEHSNIKPHIKMNP